MFTEANDEPHYHHQHSQHDSYDDDGRITEYKSSPRSSSSILSFIKDKKIYLAILIITFIICVALLIGLIINNIIVRRNILGEGRMVMMISIDGFRPDYLDMFKEECGNLSRVVGEGVRARSMRPIFPSKTFPNHYTIVTGLYAESHGIVSNSFYDSNFNAKFSMGSVESFKSRWWLGEPIWVTAEKQGMIAGSFFWPGSDVEIQGRYPTYYKTYDGSIDYETRVKTVFEWLDSDKPPQIVLTYFSAVDTAGHKYGPHISEELRASVKEVDNSIGLVLAGLEKRGLVDKVDLIIVSDHGMAYTPESKIVRMTDILGRNVLSGDEIFTMNDGPFFDFYIKDKSKVEPLFNEIVNSVNNNSTYSTAIQGVYLKSNMPDRFHFVNSDRIPDITVLAKPEYSILRYSTSTLYGNGTHGYDNEVADMGSLFIARGKNFQKGLNSDETVRNLDVYSLICKLLELTPAPNNGTAVNFSSFLASVED